MKKLIMITAIIILFNLTSVVVHAEDPLPIEPTDTELLEDILTELQTLNEYLILHDYSVALEGIQGHLVTVIEWLKVSVAVLFLWGYVFIPLIIIVKMLWWFFSQFL